jgi:threonine aldolase
MILSYFYLASFLFSGTAASEIPHSKHSSFERGVINPQEGHILCDGTSAFAGVMRASIFLNRSAMKANRLRNG